MEDLVKRIERLEKLVGVEPNGRFKEDGLWVLDKDTKLYWRKRPVPVNMSWYKACEEVRRRKKGVRLPTIKELLSLIDYSQCCPALPKGHPFGGVLPSFYWSATTSANNTDHAWYINIYYGDVYNGTKSYDYYVWPVKDKL